MTYGAGAPEHGYGDGGAGVVGVVLQRHGGPVVPPADVVGPEGVRVAAGAAGFDAVGG